MSTHHRMQTCPHCSGEVSKLDMVCSHCGAEREQQGLLSLLGPFLGFLWLATLFALGLGLVVAVKTMYTALASDISFCTQVLRTFEPKACLHGFLEPTPTYETLLLTKIPFGHMAQVVGACSTGLVLGYLYFKLVIETFRPRKTVWLR